MKDNQSRSNERIPSKLLIAVVLQFAFFIPMYSWAASSGPVENGTETTEEKDATSLPLSQSLGKNPAIGLEEPIKPEQEICCREKCCLSCCKQLYINHVEGCWIYGDEGYTTIGLFSAFSSFNGIETTILPIVDFRLHAFNEGKIASNVGLGARYLDSCSLKAWGVNAFYDYLEGCTGSFHQLGVGLELLTLCYDIRLNGYFPVGPKTKHSKLHKFNEYQGDYFATCRERQSIYLGGDLEVGKWLKRKEYCSCFDLYGSIGTYYYSKMYGNSRCLAGGWIRLASNLSKYIYIEGIAGYDRSYRWMGLGRISFNIEFSELFNLWNGIRSNTNDSFCSDSSCYVDCGIRDLVCQKVRRNEIITLDCPKCCWTWNWNSPPR